jgi:hypothetical protein
MDDLFSAGPKQLGFDLNDQPSPNSIQIDPSEIREELTMILTAAKCAVDCSPWDERSFRYHKVVFPQMAKWLPEDEAAQLCFEFAREIERIELLLAA